MMCPIQFQPPDGAAVLKFEDFSDPNDAQYLYLYLRSEHNELDILINREKGPFIRLNLH
jgi:hypothetical protein